MARKKSVADVIAELAGCPVCNIAAAVTEFAATCGDYPNLDCSLVSQELSNASVGPDEWVERMQKIIESAEGDAKARLAAILNSLCDYLSDVGSPLAAKCVNRS